jgi:integrase
MHIMTTIRTKPRPPSPKRLGTPKQRAARGAGSVVQLPSGKWQARVIRFGTDTKRQADTQAAALKLLEVIKHAPSGEAYGLGKMRFSDWLERFRLEEAPKRKTHTRELHKYYISLAVPVLGNIPLSKVAPADLRRFQNSLLHYSQSTQSQVWHFTAAALGRAFDDVIAKNPAAKVKAPTGGSVKEKFAWTQEEAARALEVLRGHRLEPLIRFMLATGLRSGEALSLRWQDVDNHTRHISILRTVERAGKTPSFGTPKTKSSTRVIPVHPDTLAMLEQHHQAQALEKSKATQWTDYGLVFPSKVGTPLDHRSLRRVFAFIAKKADVRHLTPHELRHTYRTFMRQAGISTKVTSWLMGHASERITEGYDQSHKDTLEQNRAALSLAALVGIRYDSVTAPQTSQNDPKSTELSPVSSIANDTEKNAQDSTKQNEVEA